MRSLLVHSRLIILVFASALALATLAGRPALAATYEFDFEITLVSERIFVLREAPAVAATHAATGPAPAYTPAHTSVGEWRDAAALGVSDQLGYFGLKLGQSGAGALDFAGSFSYDLDVNGRELWTFNARIAETDPDGRAKFMFSTTAEQYAFDFIRWTASMAHDGDGSVFAADGTGYDFRGYQASFLMTPLGSGGSAEIAVTPLPPAPALLLTALGGFAWLRRRRRTRSALDPAG